MPESTLSTKNQIVIPKEVRQALGVKPGDKLLLIVRGSTVVVLRRPESYHSSIRGLATKNYSAKYLEKERQSWK
jgi:antitoxin PrlF